MKKAIYFKNSLLCLIIVLFLLFNILNNQVLVKKGNIKKGISYNNKINYMEKLKEDKLKKEIEKSYTLDNILIKKINIFDKEKNMKIIIKKYGNYDKEAPNVECLENIIIYLGEEINLSDYINAIDNFDTELEIRIDGDYDINNAGLYELTYIVSDSSGNNTIGNFKLNVIEKNTHQNNSYNYNNTTTNNDGSFTTSKGFTGYIKDGITYINGIIIANKSYSLPSWYNPGGLTQETLNAFYQMKEAAAQDGLNIYIVSGFRSYWDQNYIYNNYVAWDGKENADTYSARPGHSEHQTGLAFDLNWVSNEFEYTSEGIWLNNNAYKFGFILRYPKEKTYETGYIYEPWHYRYVGTDLSYKLFNNGNWITLENYFGINSQY